MSDSSHPLEHEWRRLHPLSPLLRGGLFFIVIIGILIANLRDRIFELLLLGQVENDFTGDTGDVLDLVDYLAEQRLLFWAIFAVLVILLLIVGISWLSWRFASFRITAEAVESRRGILFKQHRRAPLDRIQSVNLQRSLLARLVGLTQVDVQTGGQGGSVALQYLGHREAKLVREQILLAASMSRAARPDGVAAATAGDGEIGGPPAGGFAGLPTTSQAGLEQPAADYAAPDYAALAATAPDGPAPASEVDPSGRPYHAHGSAVDARLRAIADFDIDPSARETGSLIKVSFGRLIVSILLSTEMLILVLLIVAIAVSVTWLPTPILFTALPVVLILVSVLISQFNKGFNFTLSRAADGVRVGAGLTSTTTETIPFGRIHAVEARQPLGWRLFGWWKVRITTAGHSLSQGGQNKLLNAVLPVGQIDDVLRVFETLLHSDEPGAEERANELRAALTGGGDGYLEAGPRAALVLWFGRKRAGMRIEHAQSERASLRIRRGWVTRSLVEMPILRAQSVQLHRPPVHRLIGLATITVHTVLGPVLVRMRGIALDDARREFTRLASTVVRVQGAEAEQRFADRLEPSPKPGAEHSPAVPAPHDPQLAETSSFTSETTVSTTTDIGPTEREPKP